MQARRCKPDRMVKWTIRWRQMGRRMAAAQPSTLGHNWGFITPKTLLLSRHIACLMLVGQQEWNELLYCLSEERLMLKGTEKNKTGTQGIHWGTSWYFLVPGDNLTRSSQFKTENPHGGMSVIHQVKKLRQVEVLPESEETFKWVVKEGDLF